MNIKNIAALLLALTLQPAWSQVDQSHSHPIVAENPALGTRLQLRDLWGEHIFWIRNYVLANQAGNRKQADEASAEVVSNATAIANSIAPLYGQPAADQLLKLLAGHWGAVKHYSDATVTHNNGGKQSATTELTDNAKAIAKFLSTANPNLPENTLVGMLSAHGGQHIAQIDQVAEKNYKGEAQTWQLMRGHILVLADTLTQALVKQFPDKFR